jgi:hypothetical protein
VEQQQQQQQVTTEQSRRDSTSTTITHDTKVSTAGDSPPSLESQHARPTSASASEERLGDLGLDTQSFALDAKMIFDSEEYGQLLTGDGDNAGLGEFRLNLDDVESEMRSASARDFPDPWEPCRSDIFDSFAVDVLPVSNDALMDVCEAESLLCLTGGSRPPKSSSPYPKPLDGNRDQIFEVNSRPLIDPHTTTSRALPRPIPTPMQTPNSGYFQGIVVNNPISIAPTDICTAECYSSMVKKLLYIEESLPGLGIATTDTILELEEAMQSLKRRVMNCATCFKRQSTLLMLVLIVERTVHLFERKYGKEETSYAQRKSVAMQRTNRGSGKKLMRKESLERKVGVKVIDECSLLVGCFEVRHGPKVKFLKSLVKMRLRRLCALSRDIQDAVNVAPEDCNSKAAQEITGDIIKRLLSLTGRVEFWE